MPLPGAGTLVMAAVLLILGFFLIWPIILLLINSFNVAMDWFVDPRRWGLEHWRSAFQRPGLLISLRNTVLVWALVTGISFPIAVGISWVLARTRIPGSHFLELMFWVSYMLPNISTTIAWIALLDPRGGWINLALQNLPFIEESPFDIYSVGGIVWAHLMANGISIKVMLLTPAFRNMDASLEEAARVSGATNLRTTLRVTLPLMVSPMALVLAIQSLRMFQSFEIEWLLGAPIQFFVYSTQIFFLVRGEIPNYGEATVLASLTLLCVALIIPFQRWVIQRRRYTTITGGFKPGLIDLGTWRFAVLGALIVLLVLLTIGPIVTLITGSFMTRMGFFMLNPPFTLHHWETFLSTKNIMGAFRTTLLIATTAAITSPILFSVLAYILVRTNLWGRWVLDLIIWGSGAIPGVLTGLALLWLFLDTPGLSFLFGTIWALIIVVVLQGNTSGTNILKGVFVQVGADMEEAARVSGAGWIRTYLRIWIPLLMPTLILLAVINFVLAAGATSSVILLASRETTTLSILALEAASAATGERELASVLSVVLIAMTLGVALVARRFGLRLGVQHS